MTNKKTRLWDVPTRLFHWSLVILVSISLYTGLVGGFQEMEYHMLSGYCILALILFRITWGFFGSHHARFKNFVTLRGILPYLRQIGSRDKVSVGHNPLGALSIIAMLTVLLLQASTGLFSDDDIMTEGPLTHLITDDMGDTLTSIHHTNAWIIYGLLALHVAAIAFYELYKRDRLILPMITGRKHLPEEVGDEEPSASSEEPSASSEEPSASSEEPSALKEIAMATILIAISAGAIYYLINYV